ncbi:MAG TPA: glycosyltransferase [Rhodocyclaceae bacterium]|nr:glycosyltransferase [Rhodocyclaceae bacterium]
MKFSIVIPLYNKAAYVRETLLSALAQHVGDNDFAFEIIVVDDGSSDNSREIVAECADAHVHLIEQPNAGVSVARNRGIELACGEWVCFLDADDWLHPDCLATFARAMRDHPAAEIIAARFKSIPDTSDWKIDPWPIPTLSYEIIHDLPTRWMRGIPFFTGSIIVKKSLLDTMQPCFPPGESFGEDTDLWFRLGESHDIVLIEQPISVYRNAVRSGLIGSNRSNLIPISFERMRQRALARPRHDRLRKSTLRLVAQHYITQARQDAISGRRTHSLRRLLSVLPNAWHTKRWWSSLFMSTLVPAPWIGQWQTWRKQRRYLMQ